MLYNIDMVSQLIDTSAPPLVRPETIDIEDVEALLDNDAWAMQQKFDGVRCVVACVRGRISARTRNGHDLALGALAAQFGRDRDFVLDGELAWGHYYPFAEISDAAAPFAEQAAQAADLVDRWQAADIRRVETWTRRADKWAAFRRARAQNIEGVIFRHRVDTDQACRHKFIHRVDCVVTGPVPDKQSVHIGLVGADGGLVPVGRVGVAGYDAWRDMSAAMAAGGDLVVEVAHRKVSTSGLLQEPVFIRRRIDKPAAACGLDQLTESHMGELDGPYIDARPATITINGQVTMTSSRDVGCHRQPAGAEAT